MTWREAFILYHFTRSRAEGWRRCIIRAANLMCTYQRAGQYVYAPCMNIAPSTVLRS